MIVAGIDLAAKEINTTGVCILSDRPRCLSVKTDEEIVENVIGGGAKVIAIDAPLTEGEPFRDGEKALIHRGFRPLPTSMESMRTLRARAERIKTALSLRGALVIETFPSAFRHPILDVKMVRKRLGIKNRHERDAFLCALVARAYIEGAAEKLGSKDPIYVVDKAYVEEWVRRLLG